MYPHGFFEFQQQVGGGRGGSMKWKSKGMGGTCDWISMAVFLQGKDKSVIAQIH